MTQMAHLSGQLIRAARQAKGISQTELAQRLQVQQGTVSKWEKGLRLPRDYWRLRLAEELGTTVPALFPMIHGIGSRAS